MKDESSTEYEKLSGSASISISHISICEYIIYNLNDIHFVCEKKVVNLISYIVAI